MAAVKRLTWLCIGLALGIWYQATIDRPAMQESQEVLMAEVSRCHREMEGFFAALDGKNPCPVRCLGFEKHRR